MKPCKGLLQVLNIKTVKSITCFFPFLILCYCSFCQSPVRAKKGILDLRNHSWTTEGITDLNGEWTFYWNSLYSPESFNLSDIKPPLYTVVPGFWNSYIPGIGIFDPAFGYATYKLRILCPSSSEKLSLKFLTVASAYKLFVNGKQVVEIGKVGTDRNTTIPAYEPVIVPVSSVNNELNIIIQVANFNYSTGGLWDSIKLGTADQVHAFWTRNVGLDFFIAGSFFLLGVFYLVVYFYFTRQTAPLYFSLFCLLLAMRPLITDELAIHYVTSWNWEVIKRTEFVTFYLMIPILSLFSNELFSKEFSKRILKMILWISVPFLLIALFATPFIFRYTLRPFQILMLFAALYGLYVYIKAVKRKRPGSVYFLIGFIILFLTIINDLLYTSLIIQSTHLIYLGLFIFVISQAIALSRQFFWTFTRLEIVNKQLEQINNELIEKNATINEANEQLTKLNAELDILVSRTSHDLRSPITSVVALVHIIREEKDEAKRNEYLEMQRKTLHRLNALITDILDFSRNKRTMLNYEPVDFNELVHAALQDHLFSENSENIERIVEVNQRGSFVTDKSRLNMVLYNLISNALKYHNKNQDKPYLQIIASADTNQAKIQVIDNGQGIDEKHLKYIFNMFYQANKTLAGSGLGLYIVNEAVRKLGGTIDIKSKFNEGTEFIITIPNHKI